ncbi:precorrin-2 C(20)-methyltransferase [Frankia sp. KB5]|uniref:precorrin-2 C(20)-methyltransferase n=1 Tax=Frankia sp. KB5 TaxID=683318 RepID=UPI000A0FB25C|nr:precorrin-2 C(20)-methyltransferase [Frankia sp. KB5]ORT56975.1 precorrin-2 C(20)-methyltransferase [Frankia sp. KB5]
MVPSKGRLWGVGVGPGDPELVTLKAARLIRDADVIAYHSARHGRSIARSVAASQLRGDQIEEALVYPVTTETTSHPGGYRGAIDEFYEDCAKRLAVHLDAGRDVVVLSEGDPFFYGSFIHLHRRLADRYPTEVVPGVTSLSAGCAVLGRPLVEGNEVLTVLPGTLPPTVLAERIAGTDTAVVLKMGRTFPGVRDAFTAAGRLADTWYVERATTSGQRIAPLGAVDPATVPYFSLAVLPSPVRGPDDPAPLRASQAGWVPTAPTVGKAGAVGTGGTPGAGEVVVVGLGPGAAGWLTPQAAEALAAADDLPRLESVGQRQHAEVVAEWRPDPARHRLRGGQPGHDPHLDAREPLRRRGLDDGRGHREDPGITGGDHGDVRAAGRQFEGELGALGLDGVPRGVPALAWIDRHPVEVGAVADEVIERRLRAAAAGDFVLALYNPASRTRRHQLERAHEVLLEHRPSDTVVVIGRDVGGPTESITVTSLGAFDPAEVDMRCLLLIGSSTTRVVRRGPGRDLVFTPRRYPVT